MTEIAKTDSVVTDAAGVDRKVLAGQPVPPDLLEAYKAAGGDSENGPNDPRPARYTDARGAEHPLPVATDTVVVKDHVGVDRKLFAGQPVPPELVNAYHDAVGTPTSDDPAAETDYGAMGREQLEALVADRELEVTGTGKNGNIVMKDLVAALEAHDAAEKGGE